MKTCKKYQDLFIEAAYGELAEDVGRDFKKHLNQCDTCRREYQEISATLDLMDKRKQPEIQEHFWDQLENQILNKTVKKSSWIKRMVPLSSRKMTRFLYPVAATLLIVIGIFLGKTFFVPHSIMPDSSNEFLNASASRYFNNVKPLLLECSNFDTESNEQISISKESLKLLLMQNYLLKKAIKRSRNTHLIQLVEDLELILIEISNRNPKNPGAFRAVVQQITDQDILFKIGNFNKNKGREAVI